MRIILLGDSTIANYDFSRYPQHGWGQVFPRYVSHDVEVLNFGKGAASTKSFIDDGSFERSMYYVNKYDYVIIQFGHNDQKSEEFRQTTAATSYKEYLSLMINQIRSLGAIPVLMTSITRRNFNEFQELEQNIHKDFPRAMIELAKEERVTCLDIYKLSWNAVNTLGANASRGLFMNLKKGEYPNYPLGLNDNTHFSYKGAIFFTELIVDELKNKDILTEILL